MISELFKLSFNQVSEAILLTLADGSIFDANAAAIAFLGYSKEQLLQKTIYELLPNFKLINWQCLQYNQKILYPGEIITCHGETKSIEVQAEYCKTETQEGASLVLKPITTSQTLSKKADETYPDHLLELIINNIPQQIFWKDKKQVYLGCNRHFAEIVGLNNPAEIVGKTDYQLNRDIRYAESYREWDRRVIEEGQAILDLEEPYHNADGEEGVVLTSKVPLTDDQGHIFGLVGICTEISEIKTMQVQLAEANQIQQKFQQELEQTVQSRTEELQEKNRQLRELEAKLREALATEQEINHLKTNIITTISHEYRTPLSRILVAANLLQQHWQQLSTEKREEYLQQIFSAVDYLSHIVDNIVSLNDFPSQKRTIRFETVNLIELYQTTFANLKKIKTINHDLQLETNQNEIWMKGDQALLSHLINHLLANAVQYSETGTTIKTRIDCKPNQIILQVKDQGIGIPPEDQSQLFDAFYRGRNVSNRRGTGLGLSIVKYVVEVHQGEIKVESELGKGSTFTVTFPLERRDDVTGLSNPE
ncbi:MAG: PAS domain-containing protein [Cyanobacteria bacterium]|jgi:PAS domain S-box-containing protein|nr:PAS domain-containing protein [Cyanobacteria bacterium GSL.Bin21]